MEFSWKEFETGTFCTVVPSVISAVAIHADAIEGVVVKACEMRHDECDVTRCANHRMRSVRVALPRPIIRVGMHIGDHA